MAPRFALALALLSTALACSATNQQATSQGSATGSTGGAGSAASSSAASGGAGGLTGAGGSFTSGGGSHATGGGCTGVAKTANPVPLDIFVMLDQSGSMSMDAGNGLTRWQNVKAAVTAFVQQPNVAGLGMGIQYFGQPDALVPGCPAMACSVDTDCTDGCTTCGPGGVCHGPYNGDIDSCDPVEYAWAEVPIQPLPGVANAILGSMGMHTPGTNTPTSPALQGAVDYATAWATAHPTHITAVALATDGDPSECDVDLTNIDAIAAAGFAGTPSIKTFVIGVGPSTMALDGIAAAGGTTAAFHVDVTSMATQQLLQVLNTLRGAAIACTYQIPPPPMGKTEDFSLVNVEYRPSKGPHVTIPKVTGLPACPASGNGWYYDDDANPTEIIVCPATCTALSKNTGGEVDVVIGCETILN